MLTFFSVVSASAALLIGAVAVMRASDALRVRRAVRALTELAPTLTQSFDPDTLSHLPHLAQRLLCFCIADGTPLYQAVELRMTGQLGLGGKDAANYQPMSATQVLAPPHGFVWSVRSGHLRGSDGFVDGRSWTRFWLFGVIPVARKGGTFDHALSAFGRFIGESVFWSPAFLLDRDIVRWHAVDADTVRAVIRHDDREQSVEVTVAPDGRPLEVVFQRWSDENADKTFRRQPFGGRLSRFQTFGGFCLPTHVEAGNHYGTDDYYPFFKADVETVRFLTPEDAGRGAGRNEPKVTAVMQAGPRTG